MESIIDDDLYNLSMQNGVVRLYPDIIVKFGFIDRRPNHDWTEAALTVLKERIDAMRGLALTIEERKWCQHNMPWINRGYWDYLANYRYDPTEIKIWIEDGDLHLEIYGLWCRAILWEVKLLSRICDVYYTEIDKNWTEEGQEELMQDKADKLAEAGVFWGDFGTRRRRHFKAQERVVRICKNMPNFTGTSNVHLAMVNGIKALGTMGHQWYQVHSALFSERHANRYAMKAWMDVYQGALGTALPDTFGTDAFLRDFDRLLASQFDSIRHDSGDPYVWAEKIIAHYTKLNIDWRTKSLGFTDGLDVLRAIAIHRWFQAKAGKCWMGIGTFMVNDYGPQSPAKSIVIKVIEVTDLNNNVIPVVKLSDNPEKATGDAEAIRVMRWIHERRALDADLKQAA